MPGTTFLPAIRLFLTVALAAVIAQSPARAAQCTAEDFAAAVDRSGAALRAFNAEAMPKLRAKLDELKQRKGWDDVDYEEYLPQLRDAHSAKLDAQAEDLIVKIDMLGRPPADGALDCTKLDELNAAGRELRAVMREKSEYTIARLDKEIAASAGAPPLSPEGKQAVAPEPAEPGPQVALAPPKPARKPKLQNWSTQTRLPAQPPIAPLPPPPPDAPPGYTIDEIREITRGFFGTISTNLGSVLEYAFSTSGRPDGYVLGTEGGGAFLAGVRYGTGTLYLRSGGTQKVYWHGPSIGTDFGASGSRTMFLIYNLRSPEALMRGFTGIDGSAYFVGGVGITFLKGGEVLMAPIRSGLGFRLGANLGYIRFTPRATWNPF
jgi:hypothetical protein